MGGIARAPRTCTKKICDPTYLPLRGWGYFARFFLPAQKARCEKPLGRLQLIDFLYLRLHMTTALLCTSRRLNSVTESGPTLPDDHKEDWSMELPNGAPRWV